MTETGSSYPTDSPSNYVFLADINSAFLTPEKKSKCTWDVNPTTCSPHTKDEWKCRSQLQDNVLNLIGRTPLVKLNKIPQSVGIKCNIYAKCEYLNPGGSVKDRIAKRMVEDAEHYGLLKPGYTLIEPSSGNTGIGVALVAAIKGYRCIIVISEKMSNEKIAILNALGAETIRTPIDADSYSPEGLFGVAHRLKREIPNSLILDQYSNPGNPLSHYDTTAEEILLQCNNQVDMIVMGAGTGGTVTGVGRKFKEKSPQTKIVAADPEGSVFAVPESLNNTDLTFYEVEGLGYDFVPTVLDRDVVDLWVKTKDKESMLMARRLIREEGLLIGTSCGAAVVAALEAAKDLEAGKNVVVIFPDSVRNYITKFACDQWMEERLYMPVVNKNNHWWWDKSVTSLKLKEFKTITAKTVCSEGLKIFETLGTDIVGLQKCKAPIVGVLTKDHLIKNLINGSVDPTGTVDKIVIRIYAKADKSSNLGLISRILEKQPFVVIIDDDACNKYLGYVDTLTLYDFIKVH